MVLTVAPVMIPMNFYAPIPHYGSVRLYQNPEKRAHGYPIPARVRIGGLMMLLVDLETSKPARKLRFVVGTLLQFAPAAPVQPQPRASHGGWLGAEIMQHLHDDEQIELIRKCRTTSGVGDVSHFRLPEMLGRFLIRKVQPLRSKSSS